MTAGIEGGKISSMIALRYFLTPSRSLYHSQVAASESVWRSGRPRNDRKDPYRVETRIRTWRKGSLRSRLLRLELVQRAYTN